MAYTLDCTIYGSSQATGLAIFLRADPGVETIVAPPVLAPHDFSNPYLRMGREGPLLCPSRPDAWQSSALMGGAWDLASSERRDGTRGRRR